MRLTRCTKINKMLMNREGLYGPSCVKKHNNTNVCTGKNFSYVLLFYDKGNNIFILASN